MEQLKIMYHTLIETHLKWRLSTNENEIRGCSKTDYEKYLRQRKD